MRIPSILLAACTLAVLVPSAQASRIHRGPTSGKHKAQKAAKSGRAASAPHQRNIDDARATQIQTALVKAGYLTDVSGHWDSSSEAAMQKLQGDNGWQTKIIPDSRALIKLGLGPNSNSSEVEAPMTAGAQQVQEERSGK